MSFIPIFRPGSVVVEFLVSFGNKNGVSQSIVQNELFQTLNATNGGLFLGDFQLSDNPNANASLFSITGISRMQSEAIIV